MTKQLAGLLFILSSTSIRVLPQPNTQTDFVSKTNLLVRIRQRTKLKQEIDALTTQLQESKDTTSKESSALQKKYEKLQAKLDNFDIYLKNLPIVATGDTLKARIQMMELAHIHYKNNKYLASIEQELKKSKSSTEQKRLKNDIRAIKKNMSLTDTLIKKTLFKQINTTTTILEPTSKEREEARAFDTARDAFYDRQKKNIPSGKKAAHLRQTIPALEAATHALQATFFGLNFSIDQAQTTSRKVQLSIQKLSSVARDAQELYDKQNTLVTKQINDLEASSALFRSKMKSQQERKFIHFPNPFLGDRYHEQKSQYQLLQKLRDKRTKIMEKAALIEKESTKMHISLEKKADTIDKRKLPLLKGIIDDLAYRAKSLTQTNQQIQEQLEKLFDESEKQATKIKELLDKGISR